MQHLRICLLTPPCSGQHLDAHWWSAGISKWPSKVAPADKKNHQRGNLFIMGMEKCFEDYRQASSLITDNNISFPRKSVALGKGRKKGWNRFWWERFFWADMTNATMYVQCMFNVRSMYVQCILCDNHLITHLTGLSESEPNVLVQHFFPTDFAIFL